MRLQNCLARQVGNPFCVPIEVHRREESAVVSAGVVVGLGGMSEDFRSGGDPESSCGTDQSNT